MALRIDTTDPAPIWSQIEAGVRRMVASGALPAHAVLPSVRDLARELNVNPATVAKAYQHLTEAGLLVVRRGEGTYVADAPPVMSRAERTRILRDAAVRYASLAATLGVDEKEAGDALAAAWKKGGKP
jgi:GntR family transcriptional regulator